MGNTKQERWILLVYRGTRIENAYRLDLIVEEQVIVEVKCVRALDPVFDAQVLTYMKLTGCHVGLILNFHKKVLREGIRRLVL